MAEVLCFGCGGPLGRKGEPPAEKFPFLGELVHKSEACRSAAVHRYLRREQVIP